MRLSRIYTALPLSANSTLELRDEPAHYISKVLRLRPGDELLLFNGTDGEYLAQIHTLEKKSLTLQLHGRRANASDPLLAIHLGLGLSRGERMDYAIQKATEAGVGSITPLLTERCEVKLKQDRMENRLQHWERIAISACEQSGRCRIPLIHPPATLGEWLAKPVSGTGFVLDHNATACFTAAQPPDAVTLLIGPEGGLTDTEIALAQAGGYQSTRLGPRVLRTETAPVIAIALIQHLWGDYS
jgi:16S rRNA (uracil1498-N3)-methyltransferase